MASMRYQSVGGAFSFTNPPATSGAPPPANTGSGNPPTNTEPGNPPTLDQLILEMPNYDETTVAVRRWVRRVLQHHGHDSDMDLEGIFWSGAALRDFGHNQAQDILRLGVPVKLSTEVVSTIDRVTAAVQVRTFSFVNNKQAAR